MHVKTSVKPEASSSADNKRRVLEPARVKGLQVKTHIKAGPTVVNHL